MAIRLVVVIFQQVIAVIHNNQLGAAWGRRSPPTSGGYVRLWAGASPPSAPSLNPSTLGFLQPFPPIGHLNSVSLFQGAGYCAEIGAVSGCS